MLFCQGDTLSLACVCKAGVGLGEAESFQANNVKENRCLKVMCSLRNLAASQKDGLNKLRFWGKANVSQNMLKQVERLKQSISSIHLIVCFQSTLRKCRLNGTEVFGTEADYWVAEAQRDGGDDEPDPDADPPGQGANQFVYYVTNDLAGEWRKLPDVKPKQACQGISESL